MTKAADDRCLFIETVTHGRVLVRKPSEIRPAGILLGFHGYAEGAETQLERLEGIPGSDVWTLVCPQGLNRFYRGRSHEVVAGWMTREDREVAIADNIRYVDAVIQSAIRFVGPANESMPTRDVPIVCAGFSQGTAMAFRAAARGAAAVSGIIAVSGDVPPELLADSRCQFPPVLLMRGEHDEWYTQAKLDADVAALASRGASVHGIVFDGGHEWNDHVARAAAEFLRDQRRGGWNG